MRLLNTSTLELKEFPSREIPGYAILSHRWQDDEVTLQDLRDGKAPKMAGYAKIEGCCKQAASDGWKWAWIDSCCIDKTSSSELSETINSMFKWYADSRVCYVYLSDVKKRSTKLFPFSRSEWFTRGWTLQELLAPRTVIFFDQNWEDIGTKESLKSQLSATTGIRIEDFTRFKDVCVARKMSWASKRETTRIEDRAYCLMGLFGINMPTLYGEGNAAFLRLQLEILSSTDDESIFAWARPSEEEIEASKMSKAAEETLSGMMHETNINNRGGLLANSPADFGDCGAARLAPIAGLPYMERSPYSMTNKGLRMEHHLCPFPEDTDAKVRNQISGNREFHERLHPFYLGKDGKFSQPSLAHLPKTGGASGLNEHLFLSLLHCKFEGNIGNVAIPIFQGWGTQPAQRITSNVYHIKGKKDLTKKKVLYIKQPKETAQSSAQGIPENASLFVRLDGFQKWQFVITHFWASWNSGVLMPRPEGGFRLSDIPSASKRLKAIIGAFCQKLQCEFVVFLDWSQGPKARIELGDPQTYIKNMNLSFKTQKPIAEESSDRVFRDLPDNGFVSVAISPGFDDGEDAYIVDIKVGPKAEEEDDYNYVLGWFSEND